MSRSKLDVFLRFGPTRQHKVGQLALIERDIVFQYDPSFIDLGLTISPFRLPVQPGMQVYDRRGDMESFGVFEDAMPDSWGRRLVDRHFQKTLGRPPGILERLAFVGERAMGALTFHPPEEEPAIPGHELDLAALAAQAWDFDSDRVEDALPDLRRVAGTSGGARPKVLLGFPAARSSKKVLPADGELPEGFAHWIVKFNSRAEVKDSGPLEFAYAELARAAKAEVPEHRLIETSKGRFFATRRIDRGERGERIHLHLAAGLLHINFRTPGNEYAILFKVIDSLTQDYGQKRELFRRVCLNVLACNRDDHLKNFTFLMDRGGKWRLSPLFDFTFHTGPGG